MPSIYLIFRLYKKALRPEKRDVTYVRMTKGRRGRVSRPSSGRYKVVDARLKKVCLVVFIVILLIFLGSAKSESQGKAKWKQGQTSAKTSGGKTGS